jgi:hypothetical protein
MSWCGYAPSPSHQPSGQGQHSHAATPLSVSDVRDAGRNGTPTWGRVHAVQPVREGERDRRWEEQAARARGRGGAAGGSTAAPQAAEHMGGAGGRPRRTALPARPAGPEARQPN